MTQASSLDAQLTEACKRGDLAGAQALALQGAALDRPGVNGPLFYAAYHGHTGIVEWLLAAGAGVDTRNHKNSTPLMAAAEQGRLECVKVLLREGANKNAKNDHGLTGREYGVREGQHAVVAFFDRNPDEVTFSWRVNDRTLQETFNFAQRERVTFIRKDQDGPVEAVTRHSFREITDRTMLRQAFEEYRNLGGKRTEEEIFSSNIISKKPKLGS